MAKAIPVVVGLMVKGGCVLMGERRPEKIYPLHWEFPGGKVETGETTLDALRRELREELSIEIGDAEEWHDEVARYSNGMTYDIHYFIVRAWDGEMEDREYHRTLWVSKEVLPSLTHLSGNTTVLERFEREGIPQ